MFDTATRLKLRWESTRGLLTTEDLWGLKLLELDVLAVAYHQKLESSPRVSFITDTQRSVGHDQLRFEILKHIIDVRMAEKVAGETTAANREKKEKLLAILAQKQDEKLLSASEEELQAMLKTL